MSSPHLRQCHWAGTRGSWITSRHPRTRQGGWGRPGLKPPHPRSGCWSGPNLHWTWPGQHFGAPLLYSAIRFQAEDIRASVATRMFISYRSKRDGVGCSYSISTSRMSRWKMPTPHPRLQLALPDFTPWLLNLRFLVAASYFVIIREHLLCSFIFKLRPRLVSWHRHSLRTLEKVWKREKQCLLQMLHTSLCHKVRVPVALFNLLTPCPCRLILHIPTAE